MYMYNGPCVHMYAFLARLLIDDECPKIFHAGTHNIIVVV